MKKVGVLLTVCIFVLLLSACRNERVAEEPVQSGVVQNEAVRTPYGIEPVWEWSETYTYRRIGVSLPAMDYRLQATLIRDNAIYFCFIDPASSAQRIVIIGVSSDGDELWRTEIPIYSEYTQIVGFDLTKSGDIAIFAVAHNDDDLAVFYAEYGIDGRELLRHDYSEVFSHISGAFEIEQAVFTEDGKIAVFVWTNLGSEIYLLGSDDEDYSALQLSGRAWGRSMGRLPDGRVFAVEEHPTAALMEVNFEEGDWGESLPIVQRNTFYLFPLGGNSMFDLLISDSLYLYGYSVATQTQTVLLNLAEMGIRHMVNAYASADGYLTVLAGNWANDELTLELFILSPVSRDAPQERTVITIGTVAMPYWLPLLVADFNFASDTYIAEVIEFGCWEDSSEALTRLQIELMTGRGPDIVLLPSGFTMNDELLLDLYPKIDSDHELDRSDFFPNMLAALERSDGALAMITDYFTIRSIIGIPGAAGHIDEWTPAELLSFVERTHGTHYPFRPGLPTEWFLRMILSFSGTDFINWYTMEANIDSAAFIQVIETARLLDGVRYGGGGDVWQQTDPLILMSRGEQLMDFNFFFGWGAYRTYLTVLGDFEVLGIPTADGGRNIIVPNLQLGISAASENINGAWEFLRGFLLPETAERVTTDLGTIPFRIDVFEGILTDISTPRMEADENGEMVEMPQGELWFSGGFDIVNVYAITAEQADRLRSIVASAIPMSGQSIPQELWDLIEGDIERFLSGTASAEDTARVIQSRVSIFLAERA